MEGIKKIECMVKGKVLKLAPEAFKIAEQYFGAEKMDALKINKPIELSKPILIPKPIQINKPVLGQPIEKTAEVPKEKPTEVIAETVVEPILNKVPAKRKVVKKAKK
ncbi:MAG: hypothetical protein M0P71_12985 [Melioribacteraceae bacterium]|jgi:hypothetical protein|nr:hypothetical protein [Melioribacteraceae bacterium]